MKCILASVIALGILVTTCNAACEISMPEIGETNTGCLYENKLYEFGSRFRNDNCKDCNCFKNGSVQCCDAYSTPVEYDEEKCEAIFNKQTCTYSVVEKTDHSKECAIYAMVG